MSGKPAEPVVLTIERIGARGDGIARHQDRPVYLPFTAPGDRVRARLGAPRDDGFAAEMVEIIEAGSRQDPKCRHFGRCGGCALQHLPDDAYATFKEEQVRAALAHRGLDAAVDTVRRLAPGQRRRTRLALHRPRGAAALAGFHARDSHRVVDMRHCAVLHPALTSVVAPLRALAAELLAPGESGAAGLTVVESGVDCLIELPYEPGLADLEALAGFAHAQDLARLSWRVGDRGPPTPAAERRPVRVSFAGVPVDVPGDAFLQASAEADRVLGDMVLAGTGGAGQVLDLFCGLGTFSFALAARATVHAIDGARGAVAALSAAANRAGLTGRVTAEVRNLDSSPVLSEELRRFDAVVFDPPRAGAKVQARMLARSRVPRIVAISCNPATFARDARALVDGGYRLTRVMPVDQFIWSPHVELVAWFER